MSLRTTPMKKTDKHDEKKQDDNELHTNPITFLILFIHIYSPQKSLLGTERASGDFRQPEDGSIAFAQSPAYAS